MLLAVQDTPGCHVRRRGCDCCERLPVADDLMPHHRVSVARARRAATIDAVLSAS